MGIYAFVERGLLVYVLESFLKFIRATFSLGSMCCLFELDFKVVLLDKLSIDRTLLGAAFPGQMGFQKCLRRLLSHYGFGR